MYDFFNYQQYTRNIKNQISLRKRNITKQELFNHTISSPFYVTTNQKYLKSITHFMLFP